MVQDADRRARECARPAVARPQAERRPPPPAAAGHAPSSRRRARRAARRLDAIGAVGIARCLTFGGRFGRPLYAPSFDPADPLRDKESSNGGGAQQLTREQYMARHAEAQAAAAGKGGGKQAGPATIDHFYEKLLTLKARRALGH